MPAIIAILFVACGFSQQPSPQPKLIGTCEGCEAVFEFGDTTLTSSITLPDYDTASEKLHLTGTIYEPDGKTPAAGIVLYVYHTNSAGIYPSQSGSKGWAKRHGFLRGWLKTGTDGRYFIQTSRPGTYPSRDAPAHIHPIVAEPDGKYYWIDDYLFADDPLVTNETIKSQPGRGGNNSVLTLAKRGNIWVGNRDIILGLRVPGYRR